MTGLRTEYDAVVVGGGHNGLVASAYLAGAGRSVLVLERQDRVGGLAVSVPLFPGVDARVSRYSYLVSLLPAHVVRDLDLPVTIRARAVSSYTPVPADPSTGLLVGADAERTAASFRAVTGSDAEFAAWQRFGAVLEHVARAVFPTLTEPLPTRAALRARVGEEVWRPLFEEPLGGSLERTFADDTVRGVVMCDALIGTAAGAHDADLLANRCFLYHVIGGGTGAWGVPVGGMGAVTGALADAARAAGADVRTRAEVVSIDPSDGTVAARLDGAEVEVRGGHVLAAVPPTVLDGLLGRPPAPPAEGSQLKVNMVLSRLPRLRDPAVDPAEAFRGTFHVNEGYGQLDEAHRAAAAGRLPAVPPCEVYCHTLTDPSILGPALRASGAHTMTLFGLHMNAALFRADPERARADALAATLRSLDAVLAEPIEDCLLRARDGSVCLEARSPVDLETGAGLPGGHIFHRDLQWPFAEQPDGVEGRWGVGTEHPRVLLAAAGARRGGGVSGIPGHNAAMAVLGR